MNAKSTKPIEYWLLSCVTLVFIMVIVGGITRLTNSGLSMVEWRPLMGTLPPLVKAEWERVFELYKSSPEYAKKHFWMEIGDFKRIFFWEWFHRFIGRLIGLAYGLPLLWFWFKKQIPEGYKFKLLIPFILGGLQGLMGWYMVKSGLVDVPEVSHFRLSAHLSLAFLIIAVLTWLYVSIRSIQNYGNRILFHHGWGVFAVLVTTIVWGAFTAGLDAGMIYNDSFPKMGEDWIPSTLNSVDTFWIGIIQKHEGVQFLHRWLAISSAVLILSLWVHAVIKHNTFPALHALAFMVLMQFSLGLGTLFSQVAVPVAALHQAGGLITFVIFVICLKQLKPNLR